MKKNINKHQFYGKSIPELFEEEQKRINESTEHSGSNNYKSSKERKKSIKK